MAVAVGKPPLERDTQRAILQFLALKKIPAWRINVGAIPSRDGRFRQNNSMRGMSDVHAILPPKGTALWIEVKRKGKKATVEQKAFLDRVNNAGGIGIVAYSVEDVEAVTGWLNEKGAD